MHKILLKVACGLLILTPLMTSLALGQPLPAAPTQERLKPALTSDEFKQKVAQLDAQTQSKLDAAIAKLLGSKQSIGAAPTKAPPTANTSSETQTTVSSPEDTTPAPTSSGSGLNLLGN